MSFNAESPAKAVPGTEHLVPEPKQGKFGTKWEAFFTAEERGTTVGYLDNRGDLPTSDLLTWYAASQRSRNLRNKTGIEIELKKIDDKSVNRELDERAAALPGKQLMLRYVSNGKCGTIMLNSTRDHKAIAEIKRQSFKSMNLEPPTVIIPNWKKDEEGGNHLGSMEIVKYFIGYGIRGEIRFHELLKTLLATVMIKMGDVQAKDFSVEGLVMIKKASWGCPLDMMDTRVEEGLIDAKEPDLPVQGDALLGPAMLILQGLMKISVVATQAGSDAYIAQYNQLLARRYRAGAYDMAKFFNAYHRTLTTPSFRIMVAMVHSFVTNAEVKPARVFNTSPIDFANAADAAKGYRLPLLQSVEIMKGTAGVDDIKNLQSIVWDNDAAAHLAKIVKSEDNLAGSIHFIYARTYLGPERSIYDRSACIQLHFYSLIFEGMANITPRVAHSQVCKDAMKLRRIIPIAMVAFHSNFVSKNIVETETSAAQASTLVYEKSLDPYHASAHERDLTLGKNPDAWCSWLRKNNVNVPKDIVRKLTFNIKTWFGSGAGKKGIRKGSVMEEIFVWLSKEYDHKDLYDEISHYR